ncbi:sulfatase-like hydrolase/transferase [Acidobacteria bacterium AH-259-A15]|nr:sulfatase-like hydrolase/transferase [Acidobacteria bacterium AH-259-A15]
MKRIIPCLLCLCFLGSLTGVGAAPDQTNVILITVDTLRADHLEAYGYGKGQTPAISTLAREGVLFENVIVQTPITLPSHASIFTATYPFYHGLQDVVGRLREGVPTIAEWFKERGYVTGAFVGSTVLMAQWGLDRGFDVYEDHFPVQRLRQIDFSRVERPADKVIKLASQWVSENRSKPFFLWIHLYDPHDPYIAPEPFGTKFKDRPYDGEIAYVDAELARFCESLKEQDLYEDSLIVLTSDHGESLGEHQEEYHAYYLYDASLRIPLIFKVPPHIAKGRIQAGTRIPNQVRSIDLAPTIVQLLGEKVPAWAQGEGLLAMMAGKRPNVQLPAYAETHYPRIHFGWSSLFSYSTPTHKFIEAPIPELYDLKKDPAELDNIFKDHTALANQMKAEMHELQRKFAMGNSDSAEAAGQVDPETMERLKALGYVAFSAGTSSPAAGQTLPDPKQKIETYNELNQAISISRKGKVRESISILEKVAREEPEMPIVHFLLGTEYFTLGLHLKAAEQFSETIRYNPNSNVARYSLARAYSQSGLSEKAEQVVGELLASEPAHFGARHLLATLLAKKRKFQEAIQEELRVLEIRPSFADAHNNLGSYYLNLEQVDQAVESYLKALEYAPNSLMVRTNLSLAYLRRKRYDQALEQAQIAIKLVPRSSLAHYYLGQAYQAKGMENEARSAFQRAKELNPKLNVPDL